MVFSRTKSSIPLLEAVAICDNGTVLLYTTCDAHAEQLPDVEGSRILDSTGTEDQFQINSITWHFFTTPAGGRECVVCHQIDRAVHPEKIVAMSRVPIGKRTRRTVRKEGKQGG